MRNLPIRVRLTLLYFVFFAAAGLLLSVASWLALRHSLESTAQHELEERADGVQAFLNAQSADLSTQQLRDVLVREYSDQDEGKYLQVIDDQGNFIYFSERKSLARNSTPSRRAHKLFCRSTIESENLRCFTGACRCMAGCIRLQTGWG